MCCASLTQQLELSVPSGQLLTFECQSCSSMVVAESTVRGVRVTAPVAEALKQRSGNAYTHLTSKHTSDQLDNKSHAECVGQTSA